MANTRDAHDVSIIICQFLHGLSFYQSDRNRTMSMPTFVMTPPMAPTTLLPSAKMIEALRCDPTTNHIWSLSECGVTNETKKQLFFPISEQDVQEYGRPRDFLVLNHEIWIAQDFRLLRTSNLGTIVVSLPFLPGRRPTNAISAMSWSHDRRYLYLALLNSMAIVEADTLRIVKVTKIDKLFEWEFQPTQDAWYYDSVDSGIVRGRWLVCRVRTEDHSIFVFEHDHTNTLQVVAKWDMPRCWPKTARIRGEFLYITCPVLNIICIYDLGAIYTNNTNAAREETLSVCDVELNAIVPHWSMPILPTYDAPPSLSDCALRGLELDARQKFVVCLDSTILFED